MTKHQAPEQICMAQYSAGRIKVKAFLLALRTGVQNRYEIVLEQPDERVSCEVGTDLLQARSLFLDVVFGGVTACTLPDVIEDRMGTLF